MTVAAIVLAAGASSRMGSPKPLLEIRGETFLGCILRTLAAVDGVGVRLAVLGHESARVRRGVRFGGAQPVTCRAWRRGMLASLRCGILAALEEAPGLAAVLVCHVDQPFLRAGTHARLLRAFRDGQGDVLIATHLGRRGHPVLLSRVFLDRLVADHRVESLAEAIAVHAARQGEVACRDAAVTQNLNTRKALASLGVQVTFGRQVGRPVGHGAPRRLT
jgi:molybdenum cofactor cytidylyltransferase